MKAQIVINRHVIKANKKASKETGALVDYAAISVKTYIGTKYCKEVEFTKGCKLVQDAANARCNGATIWIEVEDAESLIIDGIPATRDTFKKN